MDDFERLQIAKLHNKQLLIEIGILQSEKSELQDILKEDVKRSQLVKLREEVKKLRRDNSFLIHKLNSNGNS